MKSRQEFKSIKIEDGMILPTINNIIKECIDDMITELKNEDDMMKTEYLLRYPHLYLHDEKVNEKYRIIGIDISLVQKIDENDNTYYDIKYEADVVNLTSKQCIKFTNYLLGDAIWFTNYMNTYCNIKFDEAKFLLLYM